MSGVLEQPRNSIIDTLHGVIVKHQAFNAAVLSEGSCLRFDFLSREHTPNRREQGIPVHELKVPSELFNPIDLPATLNLNRD